MASKHRHKWTAGLLVVGQAGSRYQWSACVCGLRRVETVRGVTVIAKRFVKVHGR